MNLPFLSKSGWPERATGLCSRRSCLTTLALAALATTTRELPAQFITNAAAWVYGDGSHGAYTQNVSMTIEQLYQAVRSPTDPNVYDPHNSNAVPRFARFTIASGVTLFCNPWDGTNGGRIVMLTQAEFVLEAGALISATGKGHRGGRAAGASYGQQGESYAGVAGNARTANYGGGGGGVKQNGVGGDWGGGGGGGFGTSGGSGLKGTYVGAAEGGMSYGTNTVDMLYLGSGGGRVVAMALGP